MTNEKERKEKIKIAFYSHTIDYAGTWRSHERVFEAIDRTKFDPYIFYWTNEPLNNRLDILKTKYRKSLVPFWRKKEKLGPETGYRPTESNFADVAKKMGIDIILFVRSGYYEWPFIERIAPLQVEISIFEASDPSPFLDHSIAISQHVQDKKMIKSDTIINLSTPNKSKNYDNLTTLHDELGIPKDHVVLGRIGREAEFTPIALQAFKKIQPINATYIIIGGAPEAKELVRTENIDNVIFIEPTNDDEYIERYHKTIDIFAHYRIGGESFGTAIAQAMIYGRPVISHYGHLWNQQMDQQIGDGGYVVDTSDEYAEKLYNLITKPKLLKKISYNARQIGLTYEQHYITKKIEDKLIEWLPK